MRPPRFINDWISCWTVASRLYPRGGVGYYINYARLHKAYMTILELGESKDETDGYDSFLLVQSSEAMTVGDLSVHGAEDETADIA